MARADGCSCPNPEIHAKLAEPNPIDPACCIKGTRVFVSQDVEATEQEKFDFRFHQALELALEPLQNRVRALEVAVRALSAKKAPNAAPRAVQPAKATEHAIERAWQRYHLRLDQKLHRSLVHQIETRKKAWLQGEQSKVLSVWYLFTPKGPANVVYDQKRQAIVTFLPKGITDVKGIKVPLVPKPVPFKKNKPTTPEASNGAESQDAAPVAVDPAAGGPVGDRGAGDELVLGCTELGCAGLGADSCGAVSDPEPGSDDEDAGHDHQSESLGEWLDRRR